VPGRGCPRQWAKLCSVTILVFAMGTGACRRKARVGEPGRDVITRAGSKTTSAQLTDLGREVGLEFPPETRVVGVTRERGIDDLVEMKVEMTPSALVGFLARSPIRPEDFHTGEQGLFGSDHDWWDPNQAARLRAGQANLPNARFLNIGYDDAHAGTVIVYIVNHGT
jgi:hypothetical protein